MHLKKLQFPVALMGTSLLGLSACQEVNPDLPQTPDVQVHGPMMTVKVRNIAASPSPASAPPEVEIFQFAEGTLHRKVTPTGADDDSNVFPKLDASRIYALCGYSVEATEGETKESTFALATVSTQGEAGSAPMFYSAVADADADTGELSLEMVRGVARVDVNNADPDFVIAAASLADVPLSTYIFPAADGKTCETEFTTYALDLPDGLTGVQKGVFTMYENAGNAVLTLSGTLKGEKTEITVELPAVERNKVYTVRILPDDTEIPGEDDHLKLRPEITVTDWEPGDDAGLGPDTVERITLDVASSTLPPNASYDTVTETIHLSADGTESMRLAFRSDIRIDIDTIMLRGPHVEKDSLIGRACTVLGRTVSDTGKDILTVYNIKVIPQLICRSEYDIDIRLRKASMVSSYDHLKMRVAAHPKQIQTVMMGGKEWMCFNATGTALEDQIYPETGKSVEDMYRDHFVDCLGMYFQYGKENPFSPWASNNPNAFAEQTRDIPWQTAGRMPLPEGYHVASSAEWQSIMPNGVILPSAWRTASGDSIHGSVVTLPGTVDSTPSAVNNAKNFLKRYVVLESVTTGNKLFIPFGGIKANNTNELVGHGGSRLETRTAYWIKEDRYIWLIDYKATPEKTDGALLQQNRWSYDGFVLVRGVKD